MCFTFCDWKTNEKHVTASHEAKGPKITSIKVRKKEKTGNHLRGKGSGWVGGRGGRGGEGLPHIITRIWQVNTHTHRRSQQLWLSVSVCVGGQGQLIMGEIEDGVRQRGCWGGEGWQQSQVMRFMTLSLQCPPSAPRYPPHPPHPAANMIYRSNRRQRSLLR